MKRLVVLVLSLCLCVPLTACGNKSDHVTKQDENLQVNEEDLIEDAGWDELEALGKIEAENGLFTVSITIPADFVGEMTQEQLDNNESDEYTSAKLNDDGSVTYKMTKKQHKTMMDEMMKGMDESLQEMIDDENYSFTKIEHNKNCTEFNVTLSTSELGLAESFSVLAFYMFGGYYNLFTGMEVENIVVNFYGPDGVLITTSNSADMN